MSVVSRLRGITDELRDRLAHRGDTLTCQEVVELVTDFLEGALDERTTARFERHLATCPHCTDYLAQARLTRDAMGHVHPPAPSADVKSALLDAFRDAQRD